MPDIHLPIDIGSAPEAVFNTLVDIAHYGRWLAPSGTYRETTEVSELPVRQGTTYVDRNPSGVMNGEVIEYQFPARLSFHQATANPGLDITIRYQLTPQDGGTHLERTTTIVTVGLMRLIQPIVVGTIRRENRRTLSALRDYLERESPTG